MELHNIAKIVQLNYSRSLRLKQEEYIDINNPIWTFNKEFISFLELFVNLEGIKDQIKLRGYYTLFLNEIKGTETRSDRCATVYTFYAKATDQGLSLEIHQLTPGFGQEARGYSEEKKRLFHNKSGQVWIEEYLHCRLGWQKSARKGVKNASDLNIDLSKYTGTNNLEDLKERIIQKIEKDLSLPDIYEDSINNPINFMVNSKLHKWLINLYM